MWERVWNGERLSSRAVELRRRENVDSATFRRTRRPSIQSCSSAVPLYLSSSSFLKEDLTSPTCRAREESRNTTSRTTRQRRKHISFLPSQGSHTLLFQQSRKVTEKSAEVQNENYSASALVSRNSKKLAQRGTRASQTHLPCPSPFLPLLINLSIASIPFSN